MSVDWSSVTSVLAEGSSKPVAVLDHQGTVRLVNSAFERCLGWARYEILGTPWIELCEGRQVVGEWLRDAYRGVLRAYDVVAVTKRGRRMQLVVDSSRVGCGVETGLVLTISHARALSEAPHAASELDYEVQTSPEAFGRVRWSSVPANDAQPLSPQFCYQLLHGSDNPCAQCPAAEASVEPRTIVRRAPNGSDALEVITAWRTLEDAAHVRLLRISEHIFSQMIEAKIQALADRAGLSEREQMVLRYLIMGRAIQDIATILAISARTVKFHQANIIEKLGVDSRVDLMRLVF